MCDNLLAKWLAYYDPIHRGWTPGGIANGVCATSGFFFPRIRGGYNLRRGEGSVPDGSAPIVGAAGADADTIRTLPWIGHEADTTYVYRLTAINGGGVENFIDAITAETPFDASAIWLGARPNPPGDLRVTPSVNGSFVLRWTYTVNGEQAEPASFNVYSDGGTGSIDFENPAANLTYRRGRFHYDYTSIGFAHGTKVRWAVRAVTGAGVEDAGEVTAFGWADAEPPPINPTTVVSCVHLS
jgi:hypothetical protein